MARFGFAVPGRRKHDIPTVAAPQLTKAQKILGTSQINVDASTAPVLSLPPTFSQPLSLPEPSPARFSHSQSYAQSHVPPHSNNNLHNAPNWDAQSTANTCISINISEGSLGLSGIYEDLLDGTTSNTGLTDSNTATHSTTSRSHAGHAASSRRPPPPSDFGAESGVLPRKFLAPSGRGAESHHGIYDNDPLDDRDIALYNQEIRSITDASSVRRKLSAGTIMSYYDKSKVPLNISQQTSSSAMAKGLPTKAKALLDVDNSISQANKKAKKRPSKLDLTRMFSSNSSDKGTDRSDKKDLARSPSLKSATTDHLSRPVSSHRKKSEPNVRSKLRKTMSTTDMAANDKARAQAQAQAAAATKESRRISARSGKSGKSGKSGNSGKSNNNQRLTPSTQEAAGLQNLYEHYEQMTFRDVFAEAQAEAEAEAEAEAAETAAIAAAYANASRVLNEEEQTATEDGDVYDTELAGDGEGMLIEVHDAHNAHSAHNAHNAHDRGYANYAPEYAQGQHPAYNQQHVIRTATSYKDIAAYLGGYENTEALQQAEALNNLSLLPDAPRHQQSGNVHSQSSLLQPGDCSDSISSRHTRTSRASKRTSLSLLELDLQQNSILSLSSDSEDDEYSSRPKTSSSGGDQRNISNTSTEVQLPQPTIQLQLQQNQPPQLPPLLTEIDRQSFMTLPASVYSGNGRSSQNSQNSNSTTSTARAPTLRDTWTLASSRESTTSVASNRTGTSGRTTLSNHTAAESVSGRYTVHEARAITLIPAQGASYNRNSRASSKNGLSPGPLSIMTSASGMDRLSPLPSPGFPRAPSPPLSPTSVDFLMQSRHTSVCDAEAARGSFARTGSVVRAGSVATVNKIAVVSARGSLSVPDLRAAAAPPAPNFPPPAIPQAFSQPQLATTQTAQAIQQSPPAQKNPPQPQPQQATPSQSGQGRFMAVTRQEEALLAAFRKKRIQMRDSIIAEFEDGPGLDEDDVVQTDADLNTKPKAELRRSSNGSGLELHSPQPRSSSRASFTVQSQSQPQLPTRSNSQASVRRSASHASIQPPRPESQASATRSMSQASVYIPVTRSSSQASIHPQPPVMQFEDSSFPVPPSPAIRSSLSLRSSSVSSATRRTSLSLFPPAASTSRQLSPGLPSPGMPSPGLLSPHQKLPASPGFAPGFGFPSSPGLKPPVSPGFAPRFSMMWNEPLSPRSKPPTMALPPPPPSSSRSRFSEPLSPRSLPASAMTLPPLSTISEPRNRLSIIEEPLSPRSKPPTARLPTPPRTTATAKNADLDRVLTQLENSQKERRESTSASGSLTESSASGSNNDSNSGSGTTSGTTSASGSDGSPGRSDDGKSKTGLGLGIGIDSDSFPAVPRNKLSISGTSASDLASAPLPSSSSFGSFSSFSLTASTPRKKRPLPPPLVTSMAGRRVSMGMGFNQNQSHGPYSPFSPKASPLPTHDEESSPSFSELVETALEEKAAEGIPRPDSPLESPLPLPFKRNVRISAVGGPIGASSNAGSRRGSQTSYAGQGRMSMEAGWWPDDG